MKKVPNTLVNMILTLFIITSVAAFLLAEVNAFTKEPIEKAQKQKEEMALKEVSPDFDQALPAKFGELQGYYLKKGNDTVGFALKTFTEQGFSGLIELMIGIDKNMNIVNTKVLFHNETPGLGDKMILPAFKNQFIGKNPDNFKFSVKKDGGDVDAITASTITSRAYCDAILRAYENLLKTLKK
ncbi:MAG: RnfABCDGE type electron transport complex subunit G [Bacteroidales bacterium]|nr:RnfABCDGE type electron transport complex subunit G [Bacteroidales bacterium]